MEIIAHRGLRDELPENTIQSISAALHVDGISGIEFDVELTRDSKSVVLHQETMVPNETFSQLILATRNFISRDWVGQCDLSDLMQLDAGSWHSAACANCKVPSLTDVMNLDWKEKTAYIELKDATFWGTREPLRPKEIVDAALDTIRNFKGAKKVISFNPKVLSEVTNRIPSTPRVFAIWTDRQSDKSNVLREALECGASTVLFADVMILQDHSWMELCKNAGLSVMAYPVSPAVDEPAFKNWTAENQYEKWRQLQELGVAGLMSDFPRRMVDFFRR